MLSFFYLKDILKQFLMEVKMDLLERFLKYVSYPTTSSEEADTTNKASS